MKYSNPNEPWLNADHMDDEEREPEGCVFVIGYVIIAIVAVALLALFVSCKETEYIAMPEYHEIEHHHTDSIKQIDSIYHEKETVVMQLDSEAMAKYGIQLKAAERAWLVRTAELERQLQRLSENHTDTVYEVDSVPYPVEVPVEVPAQLTWWQQSKMSLGMLFIGLIIAAIGYGSYKLKKKLWP